MKYITKKHELKDKKIIDDLNRAVEMYEDGEIIEVRDMLAEMVNAIDDFTENYEVME